MEWIKVTIYTTSEGIDTICDKLYDMGYTGTQIEDESEFTEFLEQNKKYWDYVDDELLESKKVKQKLLYILKIINLLLSKSML